MAKAFQGTDKRDTAVSTALRTAKHNTRKSQKVLSLKEQIANYEKETAAAQIAKANETEPIEQVRFSRNSKEYLATR